MLAVEQYQAGFTMKQASKIIGCHEKFIYQLVKDGRLDSYTSPLDGKMMVSKEQLYHYLRTNR